MGKTFKVGKIVKLRKVDLDYEWTLEFSQWRDTDDRRKPYRKAAEFHDQYKCRNFSHSEK